MAAGPRSSSARRGGAPSGPSHRPAPPEPVRPGRSTLGGWPWAGTPVRSLSRDPAELDRIRASPDQVPRLHVALALDRDGSARLADELVLDQLLRGSGDLDAVGRPLRLHAARGIDRVTPQVIQEALAADDAGNDGTRVDADPKLQTEIPDVRARSCGIDHVEGKRCKGLGVIWSRRRHARGDHVAVADGLELLYAISVRERVKVAEQPIEHADDFGGR